MKKVLLVVALFLLATPVFAADVTITATTVGALDTSAEPNRLQKVRIGYTATAADTIRAFALVLTVDSGCNIDHIADFNRGECKSAGKGYGIFPGKFRDVINAADPNWVDTAYNPIAPAGDLNGAGGNDNPRMVVELGTIYQDPNYPGASGTLFTVDINSEGATECNLSVALEMMRGGVVKKDSNAADVTLPAPLLVKFISCVTVPTLSGLTKAQADAAIIAVSLVPNGTGAYSDTVAATYVISQETTGCIPAGSTVNYTYSLGKFPTPAQLLYPSSDPDCNLPVYWSQVAGATSYSVDRSSNFGGAWTNVYTGTATFKVESVTPGYYRYRVRATNGVSTSDYLTKTVDCNAYLSTCYASGSTSDANWNNWKSMGRPDCWCKAKLATVMEPNGSGYQCDGDADGITSGAPFNYRIYTGDLSMITNNYKKTTAQITADPNVSLAGRLKIHSACADIDHKTSGAPFNYRVYTADLAVVTGNYKKLNSSTVTATNRLPGNCPRPTP